MKLLLDTNALIWLVGQASGSPLGARANRLIQDAEIVYASSISMVEIRIKTMLGKMDSRDDLTEDIHRAGCVQLEHSFLAADCTTKFPELVRHDPFDRMLLAQALSEGLAFMTADQTLLDLGLDYVVDARV